MNIDRSRSWVKCNKFFLDLTDSNNGRFKNRLDTRSLLRMDHLIVTLFQLLIDVNILDVETSIMLEPLLNRPTLTDFDICLWHLLSRNVFNLHLLLDVIHSVRPLEVVCSNELFFGLTRETYSQGINLNL